MVRLYASVLIFIMLMLLALSYGSPYIKDYIGKGSDGVSILELSKTISDMKKMNIDRKKKIKENEKILEDPDEKN